LTNFCKKAKFSEASLGKAGPKVTVATYLLLTFLFCSIFWVLIARLPQVKENATKFLIYTVAVMWIPAVAAVFTRLLYQRNLKGFGFGLARARWLLVGMFLPIILGLIIFGSAWISGIAPLDTSKLNHIFSPSFIPAFLLLLSFNCFAALGEEIGWRGFLVPELSRSMGFTGLALLSGSIWTVWHFPLIIFGTYHGTGSLWFSLAFFIPSVISAGVVLAWLRLASGSVWVAVLFHGFWNYFIQQFYPHLTVKTLAGDKMLGEFGWFVAIIYLILAMVFWFFRNRLPKIKRKRLMKLD